MAVSRRARKVTRVMLPRRIASLRPLTGWNGTSSLTPVGCVVYDSCLAESGSGADIVLLRNEREEIEVERVK
jgi:hypothetical protein